MPDYKNYWKQLDKPYEQQIEEATALKNKRLEILRDKLGSYMTPDDMYIKPAIATAVQTAAEFLYPDPEAPFMAGMASPKILKFKNIEKAIARKNKPIIETLKARMQELNNLLNTKKITYKDYHKNLLEVNRALRQSGVDSDLVKKIHFDASMKQKVNIPQQKKILKDVDLPQIHIEKDVINRNMPVFQDYFQKNALNTNKINNLQNKRLELERIRERFLSMYPEAATGGNFSNKKMEQFSKEIKSLTSELNNLIKTNKQLKTDLVNKMEKEGLNWHVTENFIKNQNIK